MNNLLSAEDFLNDNNSGNYHSVDDVIKYYQENGIDYPKNPKEPKLYSVKPSNEEIEKYQKDVAQYSNDKIEYKRKLKEYQELNSFVIEQMHKFIEESVGVESIPEIFRDKTIYYIRGCSSNYEEYNDKLSDIIYAIFK
jgi:hypothetical protein